MKKQIIAIIAVLFLSTGITGCDPGSIVLPPVPDTIAPTVSSASPANNATNVAINTAITATFSEAMTASTLTTDTFTLNNGATGAVTYTGTTATFTPSANLLYSTTYTTTITTGAHDAAHNAIATNYIWTFTTGVAPPVTLTGIVTYTHFSVGTTTGIDYDSPTEKPIRGAVVVLQNATGTVLATTNTTETGSYAFSAPANSTVRVVVKAALGSPSLAHVTVVDNTNSGALYATFLDVTTGTTTLTADFNANSGWDKTSYLGERAAAPFALLDTIYQAETLIKSAYSDVLFPSLIVNWSRNNKPTDGDKAIGEIGTSHYAGNSNLYILGAENSDTDEYDAHVIAHEWGHYFEDKLGRGDSIGGNHGPEDILDPRVAFSEGWGNALSGMVLNDPLYIDTGGVSQATVYVGMNLDNDSVSDSQIKINAILIDGFYAETSVQELLYDLFDSGTPDDDSLSLGFKPIYDVMVGGQKTTPAYTTIFSFLHYLKNAESVHSGHITALASAENISSGDEYEETNTPIYTIVPVNGTVVSTDVDGLALKTWDIYGPITADDPGNKLFNWMFFKFTISAAGSYTIEVVPAGNRDLIFALNEKGAEMEVDVHHAGGTETLTKFFTAGDYVMSVGSFGGEATFTVKIN